MTAISYTDQVHDIKFSGKNRSLVLSPFHDRNMCVALVPGAKSQHHNTHPPPHAAPHVDGPPEPPCGQWGEHFTNGVFTTKHLNKYRTCSADKADILQKDNLETTIVNPKDKSVKPPANCFDAVGMRAPPPPYSSDDTIYISG